MAEVRRSNERALVDATGLTSREVAELAAVSDDELDDLEQLLQCDVCGHPELVFAWLMLVMPPPTPARHN